MIDSILDQLKEEHERVVYNAYADGRKEVIDSELKEALEVISFYAEGAHWGVQDTSSSVAIDPCDWCDNNGTETFRGGKRAREFLKKLEK